MVLERTCSECGSDKTHLKFGKWPNWYKYKGDFICHKCWSKLINHPKWNPIVSVKRLVFKNKRLNLKENPRIGICNYCCAVVGINCKKTVMHHYAEYDEDNPLKDTVELCASCHMKESWKLGQLFHC